MDGVTRSGPPQPAAREFRLGQLQKLCFPLLFVVETSCYTVKTNGSTRQSININQYSFNERQVKTQANTCMTYN